VKALAETRAVELGRKVRALDAVRRSLLELARACHGDDRPNRLIIERLEADGGRPYNHLHSRFDTASDESWRENVTLSPAIGRYGAKRPKTSERLLALPPERIADQFSMVPTKKGHAGKQLVG
jgi:hypothetical protein